jgi:hypothetical protein
MCVPWGGFVSTMELSNSGVQMASFWEQFQTLEAYLSTYEGCPVE